VISQIFSKGFLAQVQTIESNLHSSLAVLHTVNLIVILQMTKKY